MLTAYVGSDFDLKQFAPDCAPAWRAVLLSRWIDDDSSFVLGNHLQTPKDITDCVINGSLTLNSNGDASSLTLTIWVDEKNPVDLYMNCAVQLFEGLENEASAGWPQTFFGFHVGQPTSSEANTQDGRTTSTSVGPHGERRQVTVNFVSREKIYANANVISPGVWIPRGTNPNPDAEYSFRDAYDDIGSIVREVATADWGMNLNGAEVDIGAIPYRIQKQLQIVGTDVMEAIRVLLEPQLLVPRFRGDGHLTSWAMDTNKAPSRSYDRSFVVALQQGQTDDDVVNSVKITGLDSEISEILYADQRLLAFNGTFGYFDSRIVFRGTWSDDEKRTFRVKVGTVTDPNGKTVVSPRIDNFEQRGFIIEPVNAPAFVSVDEFGYVIEITNDVFLVVAGIVALIAGYSALAILTTTSAELDGGGGGLDFPNPVAIAAEVVGAALLLGGITVLQQIGNFNFEVYGVPFETVYREIEETAHLSAFAAFDNTGIGAIRAYERNAQTFENHIMSKSADVVTDDGTVNKGIVTWAQERLAFEVSRSASRTLRTLRDIFLEPGDAVQFDGQIIHVESITRQLQRPGPPVQTVSGFQIRKA